MFLKHYSTIEHSILFVHEYRAWNVEKNFKLIVTILHGHVFSKLATTGNIPQNSLDENKMTDSLPNCLNCDSEYVYPQPPLLVCPECGYEWDPKVIAAENTIIVKDANGTTLSEGDKVTLIKDLKVKGSSLVLKIGTKATIRRINDGKDHQLDCKMDKAGDMMVTAHYVKKA